MPSVFSLGDAVLTHLRHGRAALRPRRGVRRAPARSRYLVAALLRCALYLGPLSVAVAAAGPLTRVAWQVPAAALLLGWAAAQALAGLGATVARRAGAGRRGTPARRRLRRGSAGPLVRAGLGRPGPRARPGPAARRRDRGRRRSPPSPPSPPPWSPAAETAVVRWSLPIWLLAAVTVAGRLVRPAGAHGRPAARRDPAGRAARAYRPVIGRPVPQAAALHRGRPAAGRGRTWSSARPRRSAWRCSGTPAPAGTPPPAMLPLLAAVPILEALVGWHAAPGRRRARHVRREPAYGRHVREVTVVTVAGLLPPLAAGVALAVAAYRLPYGLSGASRRPGRGPGARRRHPARRGLRVTLLLAARGRTATAAVLAAAPLLLTLAAAAALTGRPGCRSPPPAP